MENGYHPTHISKKAFHLKQKLSKFDFSEFDFLSSKSSKNTTKPFVNKNVQNSAQLLKRNREFGVSRTMGGVDTFSLGVISAK